MTRTRANLITAALFIAAGAWTLYFFRDPAPLYRVAYVGEERAVLAAPNGWPPVRLVAREDLARSLRAGMRVRECQHAEVTFCIDHRASGLRR